MDGKEFIASLIGSMIWPLIAMLAIIIFRKPLSYQIFNLKKLKYGELELDFASKIKALKAEVDKEAFTDIKGIDPTTEFLLKYTNMARSNPSKAIIEASTAVDNAILGAAIEHDVAAPSVKGVFESVAAIQKLEEHGYLDKEVTNIFERLLELRNMEPGEAATDKELALDFVYTSARLIAYIRSV